MSTPTMDEAAKVLADPTAYADDNRLHTALTHLRANNPVAWVDNPPYRPFWAITKHADIMAIERANDLFLSEPRPLLATAEADDALKAQIEAGIGIRTLVHMDDPHHRKVRAIGADWFRPKAMRDLKTRVDELAKRYVDRMRDIGPECDFVTDIALNFPLYVILSLLGLPEEDFPRMLKLTQEMFGGDDAEHQRGDSMDDLLAVLADYFNYFTTLTASRREHPDRRPGVGDRQRPHRRRTSVGHGHRFLLRDHRQRRTRHHQGRNLRRPAGPHSKTPVS